MKTLQEQLTEIVEQEQKDEIIPFLKQLSPQQQKELIPTLRKLEEQYTTFVQLAERSYGTRATSGQHRILNLTAYLIYPLKDIEKRTFGIQTETLTELLQWHTPTWLNAYFEKRIDGEFPGFYDISYKIIMDWLERGIITANVKPETIARFLVRYINIVEELEAREITLKEHIWYLFQYDCGQNWHDNPAKGEPYFAFRYFTANGRLNRQQVLREALLAINRNLNKNLCSWFAGMFEALVPTEEEQLTLQPELLAVLSSPQSRPVNIILGYIKNLCRHPEFQVEEFLSQTSVLFASDVKAVHQNTLAVLAVLAKEREAYREAICCAAVQGLMNQTEAIQNKVVKLIQTYRSQASEALREALSPYAGMMLTEARKELSEYMHTVSGYTSEEVTQSSEGKDRTDANEVQPMPPLICEENRIQEITSPEDLIFLASQIFDANAVYHFDQLIAALIEWNQKQEAHQMALWMPVFQRAYKVLSAGSSRTGHIDRLMATFLIDYAKLLSLRFPQEMNTWEKMHDKAIRKDEELKGNWGYKNLNEASIRQKPHPKNDFPVQRHLLCRTLDLLEREESNPLPLLSTPTHAPMFIAPATLVERLKQYQQTSTEPDDMDMQIALSRVALDVPDQLFQCASAELEGEYRQLLLFLSGEKEATPQPPFAHPSWWMTASLIHSPETIYPPFNDFPYSKGPREVLTGNFAWRSYQRPYSYSYQVGKETKVVESTYQACEFAIPEGENIRIHHKGKYNERVEYRYYDANLPLLAETFININLDDDDIKNDLPRLLWLSPNAPEPALIWCFRRGMSNPMWYEVREVSISLAAMEAFNQYRHHWQEMSYLFEASSMLMFDKTMRAYAAEIWIRRVGHGCIDSARMGRIIGTHQRVEWGPLKRVLDLMQQQMLNVSALHNRELEKMITALIAALPENPVKDLKRLLEIYAELLALNHSRVEDQQVWNLLERWKTNANLKKVVNTIMKD